MAIADLWFWAITDKNHQAGLIWQTRLMEQIRLWRLFCSSQIRRELAK